ncbi:MAG: TetR family transcriptional regulator [Pseudomonadota bacterium]
MTKTKGEQTQKALELAIHRITTGRVRKVKTGRKLSIAAVAEEAGVSTATIHNRYPEIADKVRQLLNKDARQQRDEKSQALKEEKSKRKELLDENRLLRQQMAELVSRNATLEAELDHLRALVESKNIAQISPKKTGK